jgi:hypothetical protein
VLAWPAAVKVARLPPRARPAILGGMDPERLDHGDPPFVWPLARPLRFASRGFAVVATILVLAVVAGEILVIHRVAWWGWAIVLLLVAGPFPLLAVAARRVNRAARGRRAVRACGWVVVGLGCVLVFLPLYDVRRWVDAGRWPDRPAMAAVGFHLVAVQWAAAVAATLAGWQAVGGRPWPLVVRWVKSVPSVARPGADGAGDRDPSRLRTRVVFILLAWLSPAVPVLALLVMFGVYTHSNQPGNTVTKDEFRQVGQALVAAQLAGLVFAGASCAGIRCRWGAALIVPGAVLGVVLNLPCLYLTALWTGFLSFEGPMV